jgi:hypothetical protein
MDCFHLLGGGRLLCTFADEDGPGRLPHQRGEAAFNQQARRTDPAEGAVRAALHQGDKPVAFQNVVRGDFESGQKMEARGGQAVDYIL